MTLSSSPLALGRDGEAHERRREVDRREGDAAPSADSVSPVTTSLSLATAPMSPATSCSTGLVSLPCVLEQLAEALLVAVAGDRPGCCRCDGALEDAEHVDVAAEGVGERLEDEGRPPAWRGRRRARPRCRRASIALGRRRGRGRRAPASAGRSSGRRRWCVAEPRRRPGRAWRRRRPRRSACCSSVVVISSSMRNFSVSSSLVSATTSMSGRAAVAARARRGRPGRRPRRPCRPS